MADYTDDTQVTIDVADKPVPTLSSSPLYRGLVGSEYVYSVGTPPVGATDIVIVDNILE